MVCDYFFIYHESVGRLEVILDVIRFLYNCMFSIIFKFLHFYFYIFMALIQTKELFKYVKRFELLNLIRCLIVASIFCLLG